MKRILASHPHAAAFANGTAAQLGRLGLLEVYFTGVAGSAGAVGARVLECIGRRYPTARNRIIHGVTSTQLRSLAWVELGMRARAQLAATVGRGPSVYDSVFVGHDWAVARVPWPGRVDAVYAYEDGALRTFRRATKAGLERLWDLPIPHYALLERMQVTEAKRWPGAMGSAFEPQPEWKKKRKDEELSLATRVLVPSAFTRESLEAVGVTKPIDVIPFGFPVEQFAPKRALSGGPFTVVAVGSQNLRKGTPYLLSAWKKAGLRDARLVLVGRMALTSSFLREFEGAFVHVPHVPRAMLADVYRSADLLVLPTLGDGCPLVVQEAMCCGTPVLTTRCGNGPEFITNGVEGWVVPERDVDSLVTRLREAASNRDRLLDMGQAARQRAENWTWDRAGDLLGSVLARAAV